MIRVLLAAAALTVLPLAGRAGETVVRLHVQPMPAPKPVLKYQLLPELRELNPGNPAQNYLKCFAEQQNFFFNKQSAAERFRYLAMPLAELPADKLLDYGRFALRQADWSARLDALDWQMLRHLQTEGLDVPTPELGLLQMLGPALQVRFRAEVAKRRFDDAVRTAKTMFALARHLGEHPTESAGQMGLSVAYQALGTLEEMLQQPGCPNFYWALTDLPCPLVDLRKGLQGDRTLVGADLRQLRDDVPMTEEQLEKFIGRLSGAMGFAKEQAGETPRSLRTELAARVKDPERFRAARRRLIEAGCGQDLVGKFPSVQVILLDEKREYEVRRDEGLKLLALAPWQIDALPSSQDSGEGLFAELLPNVLKDRQAAGRLEQRIALVRHVEALRLFAAEHGGRLPQTLAELAVPLPPDPFTGKPFVCKVEGTTVQLVGKPPRGEEQNPCFNVRYEVTIQK